MAILDMNHDSGGSTLLDRASDINKEINSIGLIPTGKTHYTHYNPVDGKFTINNIRMPGKNKYPSNKVVPDSAGRNQKDKKDKKFDPEKQWRSQSDNSHNKYPSNKKDRNYIERDSTSYRGIDGRVVHDVIDVVPGFVPNINFNSANSYNELKFSNIDSLIQKLSKSKDLNKADKRELGDWVGLSKDSSITLYDSNNQEHKELADTILSYYYQQDNNGTRFLNTKEGTKKIGNLLKEKNIERFAIGAEILAYDDTVKAGENNKVREYVPTVLLFHQNGDISEKKGNIPPSILNDTRFVWDLSGLEDKLNDTDYASSVSKEFTLELFDPDNDLIVFYLMLGSSRIEDDKGYNITQFTLPDGLKARIKQEKDSDSTSIVKLIVSDDTGGRILNKYKNGDEIKIPYFLDNSFNNTYYNNSSEDKYIVITLLKGKGSKESYLENDKFSSSFNGISAGAFYDSQEFSDKKGDFTGHGIMLSAAIAKKLNLGNRDLSFLGDFKIEYNGLGRYTLHLGDKNIGNISTDNVKIKAGIGASVDGIRMKIGPEFYINEQRIEYDALNQTHVVSHMFGALAEIGYEFSGKFKIGVTAGLGGGETNIDDKIEQDFKTEKFGVNLQGELYDVEIKANYEKLNSKDLNGRNLDDGRTELSFEAKVTIANHLALLAGAKWFQIKNNRDGLYYNIGVNYEL